MTEAATDPRQALLEQIREKSRLPGLVAGTSRNGSVDWSCALGETGTAYRVASITKTFTAVAVMRLRDDGRLELDDPLGRHLPGVPYADATIRRLLAHASGMTAEPTGPWWERVPGGSWDALVAANPEHYVFAPGRRHHYSNLGFALLGRMVEELVGDSWWDVVTDTILAPVGLTATTFTRPDDAAIGTSRDPLTGELVREPSEDEGAMAPAGQLWSTVDDLCRWVDVLVAGHPGVLSAETAAEMRTVQAADPDTQHRGGYGLGLRLHWEDQSTVVGHTGSLPGFLAGMFCDARSRVGAVVLTNATYGLDPEGTCAQLIAAALRRPAGTRAGRRPELTRGRPGRSLVLGQRALRARGDRIGDLARRRRQRVASGPRRRRRVPRRQRLLGGGTATRAPRPGRYAAAPRGGHLRADPDAVRPEGPDPGQGT